MSTKNMVHSLSVTGEDSKRTGYFPHDNPLPVKIYILAIQSIGAVALLFALEHAHDRANQWWLLFLVLTAVASYVSVNPSKSGDRAGSVTVSMGDFFVFGAMLAFGPAAAALMGAVEAVFSSLKVNVRKAYKILFNVAQLTTAAYIVGLLYLSLAADLPPIREMSQAHMLRLFGVMMLCSFTYFLLNGVTVSVAMILSSRRGLGGISGKLVTKALPVLCVNACLVVVVLALLTPTSSWLAVLIFPLILAAHRLTRSERQQTTPSAAATSGIFGADLSPLSLTREARKYLFVVILVSVPVLAYCLHQAAISTHWDWIYLAVLTIVASCFPLRIFSITSKMWVTLSDVFVFVAMFQFGAEIAVLIACLEAVTFNLRTRPAKASRWLFNVSQIVLAAFIVAHFFKFLQLGLSDPGTLGVGTLVLLLIAPWLCGFLYYSLTSGLTSLAVAFNSRQPVLQVWRETLNWWSISLLGAVIAALTYAVINGVLPTG